MLSKLNLTRAFHAVFESRFVGYADPVFNGIWDLLGPHGMTWALLAGIHLASVWVSIATKGTVTEAALAAAVKVCEDHCLIGLYVGAQPRTPISVVAMRPRRLVCLNPSAASTVSRYACWCSTSKRHTALSPSTTTTRLGTRRVHISTMCVG